MRNLCLLRNVTIEDTFLKDLSKCLFVTESSTSKTTKLFMFNQYMQLYQLNIADNSSFENIFIQDLFQFVDEPSSDVAVAGFTQIFNEVYVILNTGYLITVTISSDYNDEPDTWCQSLAVGSIKAVSWSPDFERTVLITSEYKLVVLNIMGTEFEKLHEVSLQDVAEEQNKFVNVGWGSVETQFRGSEGKFSKIDSEKVIIGEIVADESVNICWKYNGTAFAVSYLSHIERNRKMKVFSQDGALLNVTKDIAGLQSPLDWCPFRNLISSPQTLPNKQVICFLEENALRHGDFEISQATVVKKLFWNLNGMVLACYGESEDGEFVSLWTTSNYKWYMKQNLQFNEPLVHIQWDFLSPYRLHIILKSGVYRSYEWTLQVNESSKHGGRNNKAIVSSINGHELGVTPYALFSRPPSLPHKRYNLSPNYINAVVFPESNYSSEAGDSNSNSMILYLSNNCVCLQKYEEDAGIRLYFGSEKGPLQFITPSELSSFVWLLPNNFFFSWNRADGNYFCVSRVDVAAKAVILEKTFKMESLIIATCSYHNDVIVHLDNGKLFLYRDESLQSIELSFVEPCSCLQLLNENTLVALSENRNLYINQAIKYRDVTSFYWKMPFLIMLTANSQLLVSKVNFSSAEVSLDEVLSRGVEPKSHLIAVVDDRVFLEMERGNLEVIVPRPFSIFEMEEQLKNGRYFEALKMLRKQRINLNVLYDHDPDTFMKNVKSIMQDVVDPTYLLNFITELEEHNVAASMFPWKYGSSAKNVPNKTETICESFCATINEINDPKYAIPLIAALVKQNKLAEAAKYAIKFNEVPTLTLLCDPVAVYKATLGSFDLVHALHIIQHSKLDPSEYLPFIHELQSMEENYRKFKICDYLEKYPSAFTHLANCSEDAKFEECVTYLQKHQLFRTALEVFSAKSSESKQLRARYMRILTAVAEHHFQNQCFLDAGILFEKASLYDRALKCYLTTGDWFSASSVLKYMEVEPEKVTQTSKEIYESLVRQRKFEDAGFIAYHFLGDCQLAVEAYTSARKYCRALDVARGLKDDDIVGQIIRPSLIEETRVLMNQQKTKLAILISYQERLHIIREKKKHLDSRDTNEYDMLSVISSSSDSSDGSSILSSTSKASSASSSAKRARRRERRLWNLKPGNRREEPSLLNVIRQDILQYEKDYHAVIPDLIKALVKSDELILARELKSVYEEFLASVKKVVDKTWPSADLPDDGAGFLDILASCPPDIASFKNDMSILNCK